MKEPVKFLILGLSLLLSCVPLQLRTSSVSAATWTKKCVPQFPLAAGHSSTNISPSGISDIPSQSIGEIGKRAPDNPATPWDGDDRVNALAQIGDTVYAAGEFDEYIWNGTSYPRSNIVAFNANTGEPTDFAASTKIDGEIFSITPSCGGGGIYIAGEFNSVNNDVGFRYVALLSISGKGSLLTSFNPKPNALVEHITFLHDNLVLSGRFTQVNGVSRPYAASVDKSTGKTVTSWLNLAIEVNDPLDSPRRINKIVANNAGTYAVMIGNFKSINGNSKYRRIAVLRLTDSAAVVAPWNTAETRANWSYDCTGKPGPELDVAWTPSDTRFYTASTGGAVALGICDTITKWKGEASALESTTVQVPIAKQWTGGDTLSAVACTNVSCFTSGHNKWANNRPVEPRNPVDVCDPDNPGYVSPSGKFAGFGCWTPGVSLNRDGVFEVSSPTSPTVLQVSDWNPTKSRQRGYRNVMMITPQGLWIGSDGDEAGGESHNDIVLFPFSS